MVSLPCYDFFWTEYKAGAYRGFEKCSIGCLIHEVRTPTTYDSAVNIVQDSVISPFQPNEIESINYYTISGIRTLKPQNGIYIKVVRYKNGQQESKACMM